MILQQPPATARPSSRPRSVVPGNASPAVRASQHSAADALKLWNDRASMPGGAVVVRMTNGVASPNASKTANEVAHTVECAETYSGSEEWFEAAPSSCPAP